MSDSTAVAAVPVGTIVAAPEGGVPATEASATAIYAEFRSVFTLKKAETNDEKRFSIVANAAINAPVSGLRFELTERAELFSLGEFVTFLHDQLGLDVSDANFKQLPDPDNFLGLNFTVEQFVIDTHEGVERHFDIGASLSKGEKPWNPIGKLQLHGISLRISDADFTKA